MMFVKLANSSRDRMGMPDKVCKSSCISTDRRDVRLALQDMRRSVGYVTWQPQY